MFSRVIICLFVMIKRRVYAQGSMSDIDGELGLDGGTAWWENDEEVDARISPFFPFKAKLYIEMLGSGILEGEVVNFTIEVSLQELIDSFGQGGSTYSNLTSIYFTLQADEWGVIKSSLVVFVLEPNELTGENRIECFVTQKMIITETIEIDFVAELLTIDGMQGLSWKNIGGGDCGIQQFLVENILREEQTYRVNLVLESLTEGYSPSQVNEKLGFTYEMIGVRIVYIIINEK